MKIIEKSCEQQNELLNSLQRTAHEGQVKDLTTLLAGLRDSANSGETIALVQVHRGRVTRLDERDHGAVPGPP